MDGITSVSGFIQAAGAASLIAKLIVDGIKMAVDLPRWAPILFAFLAAEGGEFLLLKSQGASFNGQAVAQAVIVGLFAWGTSIGVTELQSRANKTEEKINTALALPEGATRADLEAAVKENK